eukprot:763930-Hanusia_phi.AAC.4
MPIQCFHTDASRDQRGRMVSRDMVHSFFKSSFPLQNGEHAAQLSPSRVKRSSVQFMDDAVERDENGDKVIEIENGAEVVELVDVVDVDVVGLSCLNGHG